MQCYISPDMQSCIIQKIKPVTWSGVHFSSASIYPPFPVKKIAYILSSVQIFSFFSLHFFFWFLYLEYRKSKTHSTWKGGLALFYHIFSLTSAYTIFILCILFLVIAVKNKNHHMLLWGFSGFCYSLMFLLDSFADTFFFSSSTLLIFRQLFSVTGSCLFLHGTCHFFQKKIPSSLNIVTLFFCILTLLQNTHFIFAKIIIIPNLIFASALIIISGLMFLLYSWDESFPEKIWTGVLLLLWSVLMNQTGFADTRDSLTGVIHH